MKQSASTALFCSLLVGMGILFGVYIAFFARKYSDEQLRRSRFERSGGNDDPTPTNNMIFFDGKAK